MSASLILIPTPLNDELVIDHYARAFLDHAVSDLENSLILVEDHKPARRRWISWGLDREVITDFILFNEHTMKDIMEDIVSKLKSGKKAYLMSDGGLPAFCDPGSALIRRCHELGIKVTCSPFHNSISQAVALSGFHCSEFHFFGFPPRKAHERSDFLQKILRSETTSILMDTPYRLKKVLEEFKDIGLKKTIFLACDLNHSDERLYFGKVAKVLKDLEKDKSEFILIVE
ncbi:MAG: hypothetical protein CME69_07960 [Halobacteriovorax sp.]|nr:hypothetical protein [Halobacteriovorax sp.]|tara:strand:+ start:521 stop:1210 length:690 start_codon:yes stop_codon:yes gene_type:complete